MPEGLPVDLGRPLFVKRCLAMFAGDLPDDEVAVAARLRLVRADGSARFAAAEAAVFDTSVQFAARWVRPVLGAPGFAHWIAERDGRPVAVATTVASAADAGPAVMLTGLGSLPGAPPGVCRSLARSAILAALDAEPDALVHTHVDPHDDRALHDDLGFADVTGLQVRLVDG